MIPHKIVKVFLCFLFACFPVSAQRAKQPPPGGRLAVVVDERLAVLRTTPSVSGKFLRRLNRGKLVAVRAHKTSDETTFLLVNVSQRTHGWIVADAVVLPSNTQHDQRLLSLIKSSGGFERISRAQLFLTYFRQSHFRPEVLLLLAQAAESVADQLSRDATRRFDTSDSESARLYFLNYVGLDRFSRLGVRFTFDATTRQYHYDGVALRELMNRYPQSPEADVARQLRLKSLN